ncbi:hairy/enhancer-of-split related with YRPW motif protein 1-like [Oncorhynchus nerka]|uniref:hairy/enhancer-of-split related with YRPW motif protein 1-like n=1 Tax=Oncorhynchus nerka TaxID=8023 RepID=UPI0031B86F65
MKKKIGNSSPKNTKSMKRMLKPVIEKKRRDRINQSLSELRILLLNYKLDSRLQNPKLEKAEILDLAVEYLQKRTDKRSISNDCSCQAVCGLKEVQQVIHSEASMAGAPSPPTAAFPRSALPAIYTAGFQQCVSHLAGFMGSSSPLEKKGFILLQGLKSYIDSQYPTTNTSTEQLQCPSSSSLTDIHLRSGGKEMAHWADMVPVREGCRPPKQGAGICLRKSTLSTTHHSFCQPNGHSYPLTPDYLSPLSPCLSCSSSVFTTPPPYSSFPCHFSFPPSLSPISSNPSSCSGSPSLHNVPSPPLGFSPTFPLSSPPGLPLSSPPGLPLPSPPLVPFSSHTSLWSPVPARRQELFISSTHWRPW